MGEKNPALIFRGGDEPHGLPSPSNLSEDHRQNSYPLEANDVGIPLPVVAGHESVAAAVFAAGSIRKLGQSPISRT